MTAAAIRSLATTRLPGSSVALVNARPARDEPHGASRDDPSPGAGGAGEGAPGGAAEAAPTDVQARLRGALREAIRTRDVVAAFALRSALSAIGNAGAVPAAPDAGAVPPRATSPYVAGTVPGLGAAELPRRRLTEADASEIVRAEAAERAAAAGQCEHAGHPDRAERLRREARILLAALDETR
jgi:hypothetical protein